MVAHRCECGQRGAPLRARERDIRCREPEGGRGRKLHRIHQRNRQIRMAFAYSGIIMTISFSRLAGALCMLVVLSFPLLASADDYFDPPGTAGGIYSDCKTKSGFVPLECFEQSGKLRGAYSEEDLGKFMQKLFVGAISLGAILAVLRLAWAGFVYM